MPPRPSKRTSAPRHRGRPTGGGADVRAALIDAALRLMNDKPWERVSAKAVADAAGCDPALVTYYFGGRSGLVATVAEEAARMLRARMELGYAADDDAERALHRVVRDPITGMVEHPLLGQLYVGELLLHGDERTDVALHDMAVPYFEQLQGAVERASKRGALRRVDRTVLVYTLAALSLVHFFLGPMFRRGVGVAPITANAVEFSGALTDVVLHGVLTEPPTRRRARRSRSRAASHPDTELDPATREQLLLTAIELMRDLPPAEVTTAVLARRAGVDAATVKRHFPAPGDLVVAVAGAAARRLPPAAPPQGRRRGRPATENPEIERQLVRAAIELGTEQAAVSVRAAAERAGCDPALVTYYFGGRRGLVLAAATTAITDLMRSFELAYDPDAPVSSRLSRALEAPVRMVAERPMLAQLVIDEFLVRGDKKSDATIREVAAPYFKRIQEVIDDGLAAGQVRALDTAVLHYALGVLPIFLAAATPLLHRALRGPVVAVDPSRAAAEIVDLVLIGLFVTPSRSDA